MSQSPSQHSPGQLRRWLSQMEASTPRKQADVAVLDATVSALEHDLDMGAGYYTAKALELYRQSLSHVQGRLREHESRMESYRSDLAALGEEIEPDSAPRDSRNGLFHLFKGFSLTGTILILGICIVCGGAVTLSWHDRRCANCGRSGRVRRSAQGR